MFTHILVPLDGSKLAEQALPYAESLATQYGAKLLLLRVTPQPGLPAAPLNVSGVEEPEIREAVSYLRAMVGRISSTGVTVHSKEEIGQNASQVILDVAARDGVDLIVGVSHGRSGVARTVHGSVIEDLARDPGQPVLVIKGTAED